MIMIVIRIIAGILLLAAAITGVVSCYRWERSNDTGPILALLLSLNPLLLPILTLLGFIVLPTLFVSEK